MERETGVLWDLLHTLELIVEHFPTLHVGGLFFLFEVMAKLGLDHIFGFLGVGIRTRFAAVIGRVDPISSDVLVVRSFEVCPMRRILRWRRFPCRYPKSALDLIKRAV
jgi:hypothetical protein